MENPLTALFDTISAATEPVRQLSDETGNTQFWRDVFSGQYPALTLGAQFIGRTGHIGHRDLMMAQRLGADDMAQSHFGPLKARTSPNANPRTAPAIRDVPSASLRNYEQVRTMAPSGTNRSVYRPGEAPPTSANMADEITFGALSPYERAMLDRMLRQSNLNLVK